MVITMIIIAIIPMKIAMRRVTHPSGVMWGVTDLFNGGGKQVGHPSCPGASYALADRNLAFSFPRVLRVGLVFRGGVDTGCLTR